MSSLLQLPAIQHRAVPLSVEAWHHMVAKGLAPKRAELLEGILIEKRSKSILHTRLLSRTMEVLHQALSGVYWLRQEAPITMPDSEPEPDISVVAGLEKSYFAHPATALLVIEISVSTLLEDRAMAGLYAKAGVAEYWLFNARSRQVEVFRQPEAGQYLEHFSVPADSPLHSTSLHVSLGLAELWEGLPLES